MAEREPLSVVMWLWGQKYTPRHVNHMARSIGKCLKIPHRLFLFTSHPIKSIRRHLDPGISVVKMWNHLNHTPGCLRRLPIFRENMGPILGSRFLSVDIDMVFLGDITDLITNRDNVEYCFTASDNPHWPDNDLSGTMFMADVGVLEDTIYKAFMTTLGSCKYPDRLVKYLRSVGKNGTDSAWFSWILGDESPTWGKQDGICSFEFDIKGKGIIDPPDWARIVLFHGRANDPLDPKIQEKYPWVKEYVHV